jgi:hypothetical protein
MLSNQETYEYMKSEYDAAVDRAKHIGHKGKTKYMESLETAMSILLKSSMDGITTTQEDFGTLAICAIRYCHGRQTYMPSTVQRIISTHLKELSDKDLSVLIDDCDFQERMNLYGDERIDKPGWLKWKELLLAERERRNNG